MRKSTEKMRKISGLEEVWHRREDLLGILMSEEPFLTATVYDTMRRCGNPKCRCVKEPSHRQTLLVFTRAGRRHCRFVRAEDAAELKAAADRYRQWRRALREFSAIQKRERTLLKGQIRKRAIPLK